MIFQKDPLAVLDYTIDWSEALHGRGHFFPDGIVSATVTADDGITVESHDVFPHLIRVWLSGGTAGTLYTVTCQITTFNGRSDARRIMIDVLDDVVSPNQRVYVVGRQDLQGNPQNEVGWDYYFHL